MAKMGRPPKPTALKVLEGNPGRRPLPEDEPKPEPVSPEPPEWMSDDAAAEWQHIAPELEKVGLLTRIDGAALAGYCQAYADFKAADQWIQKHGQMYKTNDQRGNIRFFLFPQVAVMQKARAAVLAYLREFGMTPSSRVGIEVPRAGANDFGARMDARMRGRERSAH